MVKSMTGYGKAVADIDDKKITVEIRSLNSKQLDLSVKLPAAYRQCEYEMRNLIARAVQRGKVDVFVSVENAESAVGALVNGAAFAAYWQQIGQIRRELGLSEQLSDQAEAALVQAVLRLPEVVSAEESGIGERERQALMAATEEAVERLQEFRAQEGATLIADLLRRVDKIRDLKESVTPYEKARTEAVRARILEGIAAVGVEADRNRLEQEMIFYIEKLDITEEKVRLENHCRYFHEVAASEEGVGRKLGFISQEMGREINTLGSKANDSTIQRIVVQMKDELEKIKEQVLNIL